MKRFNCLLLILVGLLPGCSAKTYEYFEVSYVFTNTSIVGSLNDSSTQQSLVSYLNKNEKVASSIESNACEFTNIDDYFKGTIKTLQIGNRSAGGSLNINFDYAIKNVTLKIQPYYQSVSQLMSFLYLIDYDANIFVNEDSNHFTFHDLKGDREPNVEEFSVDFKETDQIKNIKIYNKELKARTFINEMKITFIK